MNERESDEERVKKDMLIRGKEWEREKVVREWVRERYVASKITELTWKRASIWQDSKWNGMSNVFVLFFIPSLFNHISDWFFQFSIDYWVDEWYWLASRSIQMEKSQTWWEI